MNQIAGRNIGDLFSPWVAIETDGDGVTHVVKYPPLLDMIDGAQGAHADDAHGASVGGSRVPLNLNALTLMLRIDRESRDVASALALPCGDDMRRRLAAIARAIDAHDDDAHDRAERTAQQWRRDAREFLGLDARRFAPHAPCPNTACERWSTLRVDVYARAVECVECGSFWSDDDYASVASWVSWCGEHIANRSHLVNGQPCEECATERADMAQRDAARRAERRAQVAA